MKRRSVRALNSFLDTSSVVIITVVYWIHKLSIPFWILQSWESEEDEDEADSQFLSGYFGRGAG